MTDSPHKVALVTGAARGIGLAVAKRFLGEGYRVALLDIEGELLQQSVAALNDPDNILAIHADVSDANAVAQAFAAVQARFAAHLHRPRMQPGDALLFDGHLLHRTALDAHMHDARTSLELRFFSAAAVPARVAGDRYAAWSA